MFRQVAVVSQVLDRARISAANPWTQVLVGIVAALGAAALRLVLAHPLEDALPYLTFFPAVAIASWAAGLRGGVSATATSAGIASSLLLWSNRAVDPRDIVGLGIFLGAGLLISALGGQLHATRIAAEAARDRSSFLSEASAILQEQLDPMATLDSLSRAAVPRFADWCSIDLFEPDGTWREARIAAIDPSIAAIANRIRREYPYASMDPAGVPAVFRTGDPEFMLDVPDHFMDVIKDRTLRDLMNGLRIRSFISVPLASPTGRRSGVLTVVMSTSGRRFSSQDVATAVDLGRRAGTALEHATLFRDTKVLGEELDAVIRALEDPVLVARADGSIVRSNAAATRALGEVVGTNLDAVLATLQAVPGRASVMQTAGGTYVTPMELDATAGDSTSRITILRDQSEVMRTEAARDAFVGMLSHELRTPITTIYGVAQVLRRQPSIHLNGELVTDLALETERLYRLVEDLLVLSRFERGRLEMSMEPVLVNRVVEAAARRVAELYPGLTVDVGADAGVPPVSADPTYLEQVVRNIVGNAVKYAGEQAHVRIEVASAEACVRIAIDDDGPGIPEADRERIFELYERLDGSAAQPGSGIGLFVCRQLIDAMGGTISGERAASGGARFAIELPVMADEQPVEPAHEPGQIYVLAGED